MARKTRGTTLAEDFYLEVEAAGIVEGEKMGKRPFSVPDMLAIAWHQYKKTVEGE